MSMHSTSAFERVPDELRTTMRAVTISCLFAGLCIAVASTASLSDGQGVNLLPRYGKDEDSRIKRQSAGTTTTTTQRPRKNRPGNIFQLISTLVSETRDDTSRAFNEIGNLFNSQFSPPTPKPAKTQHAMSSPPTGEGATESDEDNEITTTTEPYRITRDEFFGILRSNVQGLMRLFQKELRNALRDSNQNARQFGKEFRNAIMPYVT